MKILKKIIKIILIIIIVYLSYNIYLKYKNGNVILDSTMIADTYNGVVNIKRSDNSNLINISKTDENNNYITTNHFYYNQLNNNAKIIYNKIEQNIPNLKLDNYKLDFSTQFNTLLNQSDGTKQLEISFQSALDAFFYDHPELFYIDLTKLSLLTRSQTFGLKTTHYVSIIPKNNKNYLYDQFSSNDQSLEKAINQVNNIKNSFVNGASGDNYHKVLQVHDTLIDMISYDRKYNNINRYNIYGALVNKQVVCEGYAKSFKYILDALNIPCILVSGTGTNSNGETESHMWNYVQLNGQWYGVDLTWDDPIIIGGLSSQTIRHDYLCRGSKNFISSHMISNKISDNGMSFTYPTLSKSDFKK